MNINVITEQLPTNAKNPLLDNFICGTDKGYSIVLEKAPKMVTKDQSLKTDLRSFSEKLSGTH